MQRYVGFYHKTLPNWIFREIFGIGYAKPVTTILKIKLSNSPPIIHHSSSKLNIIICKILYYHEIYPQNELLLKLFLPVWSPISPYVTKVTEMTFYYMFGLIEFALMSILNNISVFRYLLTTVTVLGISWKNKTVFLHLRFYTVLRIFLYADHLL